MTVWQFMQALRERMHTNTYKSSVVSITSNGSDTRSTNLHVVHDFDEKRIFVGSLVIDHVAGREVVRDVRIGASCPFAIANEVKGLLDDMHAKEQQLREEILAGALEDAGR